MLQEEEEAIMASGSVNKVILIGNLGRDPELRYTANGQPVANFSLATNERRVTPDGERRDITTWHRIVAWGKLAEFVQQYLTKGLKVYVDGRLSSRQWTTKTGETRTTVEVVAREIVILSPKGANLPYPTNDVEESTIEEEPPLDIDEASDTEEDDIPF